MLKYFAMQLAVLQYHKTLCWWWCSIAIVKILKTFLTLMGRVFSSAC